MSGQMLKTFIPLVLLLVVMYFLLIRPQKKREKNINEMRNQIQVGDEIITIGGICGKVVKTKDDSLVIQVGADKVKFEIMRWAVSKTVEKSQRPSKKPVEAEPEEEPEAEEAPKKSLPKRMKPAADSAPEETAEAEETPAEPAEEPSKDE